MCENSAGVRRTLLYHVTKIGHVHDGLVRQWLAVVFEHVVAQLLPHVGTSGQDEEHEGEETGCSVACG